MTFSLTFAVVLVPPCIQKADIRVPPAGTTYWETYSPSIPRHRWWEAGSHPRPRTSSRSAPMQRALPPAASTGLRQPASQGTRLGKPVETSLTPLLGWTPTPSSAMCARPVCPMSLQLTSQGKEHPGFSLPCRARVLGLPRLILEQPREPPVLQHPALGLARRAVAHHVVLVEHRLELVAASRARLAVAAVDRAAASAACPGSAARARARSVRSRAEDPHDRVAQPCRPRRASRSEPRLNGDSLAACRISSTHERPIPAITCWSRSSAYSGRGSSSSSSRAGGSGHASGPSSASVSSRRLRGRSTLTHARCLVPNSRRRSSRPSVSLTSRREVRSRSEARVSNSCSRPADIRWIDQRQVAVELDHEQLASPADPGDRGARRAPTAADRTSSARSSPGASADSISAPATAAPIEQPRGDLDLG